MKSASIAALSALLGSAVNAIPLVKRDIVWVTQTDIDTVVVPVIQTVWVNGPDATLEHQHHHHTHHTVHVTSTVHVTPTGYTSVAAPTSTSVYVAPTTSSSVYVAPTTSSSSVYVAPTTSSTSVYVPPPTSSTSVYVAPTTTPAPYTPPTPTTSQPATSASAPAGSQYTGDLTFYSTGMGSCGIESADTDAIVALAVDMMSADSPANPNDNPLCGKQVSISYGGVTKTATIVDTCEGCEGASLDLSPSLFSEFAAQSVGRLTGATWSYT